MRAIDLITKKKQGLELNEEEIRFLVRGITDGSIPDYQLSAFCMAVIFRSMTERETAMLTDAMARSGDSIDLSEFGQLSVDKHSTGGVGDKTSLILAPITAAAGAVVAKMSGRGLGHTGGTVDKLESIPGYRTELSIDEFLAQSRRVGLCLIGQSKDLAPADKRLYALRDVTSTVDSVPLITSSVMSKKLAAGASAIVLDVTVGSGAFMKTPEDASVLAKNMVEIGRRCGRKMTALITNMDEPLGFAIGNSLEVQEAVSVLKGQLKGDVYEVSLALAAEQLALVFELAPEKARALAEEMVSSGKAFAKMKEWVAAQGGDVRYLDEPERFPRAAFTLEVPSPRDGFVCRMDTEAIGNVAGTLGAGRARAEEAIDFAAGIVLKKKIGAPVRKGEPLCVLHTERQESLLPAMEQFLLAVEIGSAAPAPVKLIHEIIR